MSSPPITHSTERSILSPRQRPELLVEYQTHRRASSESSLIFNNNDESGTVSTYFLY
jgi:hypothetical protein